MLYQDPGSLFGIWENIILITIEEVMFDYIIILTSFKHIEVFENSILCV